MTSSTGVKRAKSRFCPRESGDSAAGFADTSPMTVVVHQTNGQLRFSWPLGPRLLRYVPPLVGTVMWSSLGFALSDYFRLSLMIVVGVAMVPSVILLGVVVPSLAAEFNRRTVVLSRRGSQIAVGAAGPFAPEQLSIAVAQVKRWGKLVSVVTLSVRTVVIRTPVEMEVLCERFASQPQAEELAVRIREFLSASG